MFCAYGPAFYGGLLGRVPLLPTVRIIIHLFGNHY